MDSFFSSQGNFHSQPVDDDADAFVPPPMASSVETPISPNWEMLNDAAAGASLLSPSSQRSPPLSQFGVPYSPYDRVYARDAALTMSQLGATDFSNFNQQLGPSSIPAASSYPPAAAAASFEPLAMPSVPMPRVGVKRENVIVIDSDEEPAAAAAAARPKSKDRSYQSVPAGVEKSAIYSQLVGATYEELVQAFHARSGVPIADIHQHLPITDPNSLRLLRRGKVYEDTVDEIAPLFQNDRQRVRTMFPFYGESAITDMLEAASKAEQRQREARERAAQIRGVNPYYPGDTMTPEAYEAELRRVHKVRELEAMHRMGHTPAFDLRAYLGLSAERVDADLQAATKRRNIYFELQKRIVKMSINPTKQLSHSSPWHYKPDKYKKTDPTVVDPERVAKLRGEYRPKLVAAWKDLVELDQTGVARRLFRDMGQTPETMADSTIEKAMAKYYTFNDSGLDMTLKRIRALAEESAADANKKRGASDEASSSSRKKVRTSGRLATMPKRRCVRAFCGRTENVVVVCPKCNDTRIAAYCSEACRRADLPEHEDPTNDACCPAATLTSKLRL